jgi:hypothetical protein
MEYETKFLSGENAYSRPSQPVYMLYRFPFSLDARHFPKISAAIFQAASINIPHDL